MADIAESDLLNEDSQSLFDCTMTIRKGRDDWHYPIMPKEDYKGIVDPGLAGSVLWIETLYRCHISALVSLFKAARWIDAVHDAVRSGNLLTFSTTLRGFIESCTDAFYTTRAIPLTLARDYFCIKKIIARESPVLLTHEKLEDLLIHFTHAEKWPKQIEVEIPDNVKAKPVHDYLQSMSKEDPKLEFLYGFLCQIAHPSVHSNGVVLFLRDNEMIVCGDSFDFEKAYISDVAKQASQTINQMYKTLGVNCLEILMFLNLFKMDSIITHFPLEASIEIDSSWAEIMDLCERSRVLYENALKTRTYK